MNESREDTATVCRRCATSIDSTRPSTSRQTCPNCGGALKRENAVSWTNVARVASLAEAGFLTDELIGLDIDARTHQLEDFNALNDRWTAVYLIQVPTEDAEQAVAQIARYRDEDLLQQGDDQLFPSSVSNRIMDPLFWRPVALIVLTGIASFVVGQRLSGQNAARPLSAKSLPSTANQISRPFVTEPAAGKPRYRLSFNSQQQAWSLETDRDNDGRYESRQQFHATGAAW